MTDIGHNSRRAFLQGSSLFLLENAILPATVLGDLTRRLRIGMVTDLHYADKPSAGSRHYRETLAKLEEAAERFHKDQPDLVVELGDFIDAADSIAVEKSYLARVYRDFVALPGKKHFVLGNHCVHTLTKEEFLEGVGQERSCYSFDAGGFHFVVLDACFRKDGEPYGRKNFVWTDASIPADQLEWLEADLQSATSQVIIFVHQRLDVSNNYGVRNAEEVRKLLEASSKVLAVFQGHSHKNDLNDIGGIHYCTLVAMIEGSGKESNGYATMDLFDGGAIHVAGFRRQKSYEWP